MTETSFTIRAYHGCEEAALLELWNAAMTHDRITPVIFRTKVLLDLNFNPDGLLVAESAGRLVGFLLSLSRQVPQFLDGLQPDQAWITAFGVHPAFRGHGIGTALFDHTLTRLARMGKKEVAISPYTPNYFVPGIDIAAYPETIVFLEKHGWQITSEPISMRVETTGFQVPEDIKAREAALAADGYAVRPVTPADLPELMTFIQRCFSWDWVRHAQDYLLELFGAGSDQVCFLIATHNGRIVGYCQQRRERFGPFGVDPSLRSRGLGRVLLTHCLAEMLAKGFHAAWFLWTGRDAARLYSLAGFKEVRQFAVMKKTLAS
ncbi:MAG TPA: GNAT family N-acetyltransferase [Anaerolineaceae bacterium]